MERSKNDVWVGLFVLIGAAALVFLALQSANLLSLNWQPTYRVTALFDNIGGLKPKAAVRSAGVLVGRVADIRFDDQRFQAQVTLEMDTRYHFPKDSSLKVLTSGLLGEQYIGVEAGASEENLAAGDVVKSTQSAVVLENVISQFLYHNVIAPHLLPLRHPTLPQHCGLPPNQCSPIRSATLRRWQILHPNCFNNVGMRG